MVLEDAGIRADGPPAAVGTVSSVPARSWTARRTPSRETPASSSCPLSWRVFWPPARRLSRGYVPGWETVLASVCGRSATTCGPRREGERPQAEAGGVRKRRVTSTPDWWWVPLSGPDGEATVLEDVVRSRRAFNLANVVREAIAGGRGTWHLAKPASTSAATINRALSSRRRRRRRRSRRR